jgi:hypothetical protein
MMLAFGLLIIVTLLVIAFWLIDPGDPPNDED